ncbi:MAG: hypothetical protein FWH04_04585 [Oscillospiraceae bacterium]|nr:hypothetical protein [Oscillospiraceae bacterium]
MRLCDKKAVTVNPTNKCNLRCEYCVASSAEEQANTICIPLDFALKGIEDALQGNPTGIRAEIVRFYSPGEPTQAMDIIRACTEYARKINPDIKTEIQTNGLFSNEDTRWIAENIDIVWFSLDGPPEINDAHRPDEHGKGRTLEIENNMALIQKKSFVGVRSTVVEETMENQELLVSYYKKLGIDYLVLAPVLRQIKRNDVKKEESEKNDIMIFAHNFLKAYSYGLEQGVNVLCSLTSNFDQKTHTYCPGCVPMPKLNPDGSVSSCDLAFYRDTNESLKCFIYGEWDNESSSILYFNDKIKFLQSRILYNLVHCIGCNARDYCAGWCAARIARQTGNIFDFVPDYCEAIKYLQKNIVCGENILNIPHP